MEVQFIAPACPCRPSEIQHLESGGKEGGNTVDIITVTSSAVAAVATVVTAAAITTAAAIALGITAISASVSAALRAALSAAFGVGWPCFQDPRFEHIHGIWRVFCVVLITVFILISQSLHSCTGAVRPPHTARPPPGRTETVHAARPSGPFTIHT